MIASVYIVLKTLIYTPVASVSPVDVYDISSHVVNDDPTGSKLAVLPFILNHVQTPFDHIHAQSVWIPLESVPRDNLSDVFESRRQQNYAMIVVIGHEDELLLVDSHVPRNVQLKWVRGPRRTAERLDHASVDVKSADAVFWVFQTTVADDELTAGQLDRMPRVGHITRELDGADWIATMCEFFDGADVVAGDENVVCDRGHRHSTGTVTHRPLRHCPVHLNAMHAIVDVVRYEETAAVAARRHVRKTFQIRNIQTPEKTVTLDVEDFDLFSLLPAQHVDVVVE